MNDVLKEALHTQAAELKAALKDVTTGLFALLVLVPLSLLFSGFVLSILWGWFVSPAVLAVPLTWPAATGLLVVIRFLFSHKKESATSANVFAGFYSTTVRNVGYLALGWATHEYALPGWALLF